MNTSVSGVSSTLTFLYTTFKLSWYWTDKSYKLSNVFRALTILISVLLSAKKSLIEASLSDILLILILAK